MPQDGLRVIKSGDLLAERVYGQLSTAILDNRLPPGTSLSVPEISRRLGISRSPVREAVQRLIWDGLADYRGRRGTVVSTIALDDFTSLLEVREVLEALAARRAARHGTHDERQRLTALQSRFAALSQSSDKAISTYTSLDMRFHELIRRMARNPDLDAALGRSQGRAHLSLHSLWTGARNVAAAQIEHASLCEAIVAGDEQAADAAARAHIRNLRQRVMDELGSDEVETS